MKKILKEKIKASFIVMIIITVIMYILTCFYLGSFNIFNCTQDQKLVLIIIWVVFQVLNTMFNFYSYLENDKNN